MTEAPLDMIRKLRRLAESNGDVEEARLAARRVVELMAKYRIDEAMLDAPPPAPTLELRVVDSGAASIRWRFFLAYEIGAANGCAVFIDGQDIAAYGRPVDLDAVVALHAHCKRDIGDLRDRQLETDPKLEALSWALGAVDHVADFLEAGRRHVAEGLRAQAQGKAALLHIDDAIGSVEARLARAREAARQEFGLVSRPLAPRRIDPASREHGRVAAKALRLGREARMGAHA